MGKKTADVKQANSSDQSLNLYPQGYHIDLIGALAKIHPASRDLFVFLIDEGKKEAPLKLCPAFEVTVALFSGLVNLVLYHQIGFLSATICLLIY